VIFVNGIDLTMFRCAESLNVLNSFSMINKKALAFFKETFGKS